MSETSKKALLDTDFLFKTQLAQNRNREPLADLIMQFEGYDFFCHEKIIRVTPHNSARANPEKIWVLMMALFADVLCVPQEKVTKSGCKFSGRRRWRIVRCCLSELQTHGFSPDPIPWIEEQVAKGKIQLFSGSKILDEIDELFGSGSPQLYYDMLKTSCDAFPKSAGKSFFTSYYYPQDEERKRNGVPVRKK